MNNNHRTISNNESAIVLKVIDDELIIGWVFTHEGKQIIQEVGTGIVNEDVFNKMNTLDAITIMCGLDFVSSLKERFSPNNPPDSSETTIIT